MFNKKSISNRLKEVEVELIRLKQISTMRNAEDAQAWNEAIKTLNKPGPDAPILLIKFGDKGKGWIPNVSYWIDMLHQFQSAKLNQKYNIIFSAYAVDVDYFAER